MADENKPPTQAERLTAVEEKVAELDKWGDEVQGWIDQQSENNEVAAVNEDKRRADAEQRHNEVRDWIDARSSADEGTQSVLVTLTERLNVLLDNTYGKNVRPAVYDDNGEVLGGLWSDTRVPDPDDADIVAVNAASPASAPAAQSTADARVDALESKLDRVLAALEQKG